MKSNEFHIPVLTNEVVQFLVTNKSGIYVDCTVGGGGHSGAILASLDKNGKLIGIDVDEEALTFSQNRLKKFESQIKFIQGNFVQLNNILNQESVSQVDGILYDLGVSSYQINTHSRGFSYLVNGPLDMRMDSKQKLTAEKIINEYTGERLADIFRQYGEEKYAKSIARAIIQEREKKYLSNTEQLADTIKKVVPYKYRIKSLSRIFQALRIEINQELKNLSISLDQSISLLKRGGRLVIISYHSLEDRIVKTFFQNKAHPCTCPPDFPECICGKKPLIKVLTKRVIKPTPAEISSNPRSRSARLRAAERL